MPSSELCQPATSRPGRDGEIEVPLHASANADPEWAARFREAERRGFRIQLKVWAIVLLVIVLSFLPTTWNRLRTVAETFNDVFA